MLTFTQKFFNRYTLLLLVFSSLAYSQVATTAKDFVVIKDAWVRPNNPGQDTGAAYMTLTSAKDIILVSIESDITPSVEIHSMSMENGVMKMRMLDTLPLVAGKPYKLTPSSFHLMLFDLKTPLIAGKQVNFLLTFKMKNNTLFKKNIKVTIKNPPATE